MIVVGARKALHELSKIVEFHRFDWRIRDGERVPMSSSLPLRDSVEQHP
jgi:hypothetical protein